MTAAQISSLSCPPPYNFLLRNRRFYSQKLYAGDYFNNYLWRSILNSIIADIDKLNVGIQIISPFGFEVMQNKRFLKSSLRRFYCYIGIPKQVHLANDVILSEFNEKFFYLLKKIYPDFYSQIVLKVMNDSFIKLKEIKYACHRNDKLIDMQLRVISNSLLEDYADYIICCLPAIYYGQDEPKEFLFNARFRNRTYQLYLMLEKLFGSYVTSMNCQQVSLLKNAYKKVNNSLEIFFNDTLLYTPADEVDKIIFHQLIIPRVEKMIIVLTRSKDTIKIISKSYHVDENLSFSLCKKIYDSTKKFIVNSYNEFY